MDITRLIVVIICQYTKIHNYYVAMANNIELCQLYKKILINKFETVDKISSIQNSFYKLNLNPSFRF